MEATHANRGWQKIGEKSLLENPETPPGRAKIDLESFKNRSGAPFKRSWLHRGAPGSLRGRTGDALGSLRGAPGRYWDAPGTLQDAPGTLLGRYGALPGRPLGASGEVFCETCAQNPFFADFQPFFDSKSIFFSLVFRLIFVRFFDRISKGFRTIVRSTSSSRVARSLFAEPRFLSPLPMFYEVLTRSYVRSRTKKQTSTWTKIERKNDRQRSTNTNENRAKKR